MAAFTFAVRGPARLAMVLALVLVAFGALASMGTTTASSTAPSALPSTSVRPASPDLPGAAVILPGQSSIITANVPSSGTAPYSWQWLYSTNEGGSYEVATSRLCGTPSGQGASAGAEETCTFRAGATTPPGTYEFELRVTDGATVPETAVASALSAVTVEAVPTASGASSGAAPQFDTDPQEDCTGGCDTTNWFAGTGGSGALVITTAQANELLLLEITDSGQTGMGLSTADIADTQGSTWEVEPGHDWDGFGHDQYIFYAIDATAGSDTVTLDTAAGTHTGATTATAVLAAFTGVDTAAPIAAEGTFETGTGTQSTASVTSAVSPTTIVGVVSTENGATGFTPTAAPAFTESGTINDGAATASFMEYYAATATGTYTSEPTWTGSVHWGAVAIAIQGASPLSVTVSPTAEVMDQGQTATITATATGGTGTLSYTWSINSGSCPGFVNSGAATLGYTPSATTTNCVLTVTVEDADEHSAQPTTPASVTVNTQLATPATPTPSAVALDVNQAESVTGTIPSTGTPTYAWTWLVSVNGGTFVAETHCAVNGGTHAAAGATETCAIATNVLTAGDTYNFELQVTDSATSPVTVTSGASATVTVSSALTAPAAPSVSATKLDLNQALTVTVTLASTGTSPYSWQWLVSVNGGAYVAATQCVTNSGSGATGGAGETCSIAASTLTAGDTYAFELKVTDSATTAESQTSATSSTVAVSSALTAPAAPTASATALDVNQAMTVSGTIPSTGTSTYAWQWLVSVDGGGYVATTQCAVNSGSGDAAGAGVTCAIAASTLTSGDTYAFELKVTDSATIAESQTSAASSTVAVSSALTAPAAPAVSATALDVNQALSISGTIPSTGTSTYSWQWLVSVNGGAYAATTQCSTNSGNGATGGVGETCSIAASTLTAGDTYAFELKVTDSATTPESQTSGASSLVTASSALTAPTAPAVSAAALDVNQALTVSGTLPSTGTPTYSWQWLVSVNGGGYAATTQCAKNSGTGAAGGTGETCSIAANSLTAGDSYTFELEVTDSATTSETAFSSPSSSVAVNSALTAPAAPTVSATALDADQTETVTGTIPSTGTAPYSWQWLVSVNGMAAVAATTCAQNGGSGAAAGATETCSIAGGTLTAGATYSFELQVTDGSDAGPETQLSTLSATVSVASPLAAPAAPTLSNSTLSLAESLTVSSTLPSSGTPSYSWLWLISVNQGTYARSDVCGSSASGTGGAAGAVVQCTVPSGSLAPGSRYTFEIEVTDSATAAERATSAASSEVTVAEPSIGVGTSQGPIGAVYSVAGSGFSASSTVTVSFGSALLTPTACTDGSFSGTDITTDASGRFDCTFVVPSEGPGSFSILGMDHASSGTTPAFSFLVTAPAITVTPTQGRSGDTVTVNGTGFSVSTPLASLVLDSMAITSCIAGSLTTNSDGTFSCTFAVPNGISGSTVTAADAGGSSATATYTIVVTSPSSSGLGVSTWVIVGVVMLVAVLLIVLGVRRRRSSRNEDTSTAPPPAPTPSLAAAPTVLTAPTEPASSSTVVTEVWESPPTDGETRAEVSPTAPVTMAAGPSPAAPEPSVPEVSPIPATPPGPEESSKVPVEPTAEASPSVPPEEPFSAELPPEPVPQPLVSATTPVEEGVEPTASMSGVETHVAEPETSTVVPMDAAALASPEPSPSELGTEGGSPADEVASTTPEGPPPQAEVSAPPAGDSTVAPPLLPSESNLSEEVVLSPASMAPVVPVATGEGAEEAAPVESPSSGVHSPESSLPESSIESDANEPTNILPEPAEGGPEPTLPLWPDEHPEYPARPLPTLSQPIPESSAALTDESPAPVGSETPARAMTPPPLTSAAEPQTGPAAEAPEAEPSRESVPTEPEGLRVAGAIEPPSSTLMIEEPPRNQPAEEVSVPSSEPNPVPPPGAGPPAPSAEPAGLPPSAPTAELSSGGEPTPVFAAPLAEPMPLPPPEVVDLPPVSDVASTETPPLAEGAGAASTPLQEQEPAATRVSPPSPPEVPAPSLPSPETPGTLVPPEVRSTEPVRSERPEPIGVPVRETSPPVSAGAPEVGPLAAARMLSLFNKRSGAQPLPRPTPLEPPTETAPETAASYPSPEPDRTKEMPTKLEIPAASESPAVPLVPEEPAGPPTTVAPSEREPAGTPKGATHADELPSATPESAVPPSAEADDSPSPFGAVLWDTEEIREPETEHPPRRPESKPRDTLSDPSEGSSS